MVQYWLENKLFFVGIPKNASRSIISVLEKLNIQRKDIMKSHFISYWINNEKNIPFSFTFISNPYRRTLTLFKYSLKKEWITDSLNFKDFVEILYVLFNNSYVTNENLPYVFDKKKCFESIKFTKEKLDFFCDNILNIIELVRHCSPQYKFITQNDKIMVDFVGRLENMEEDWHKLYDTIKKKTGLELCKNLYIMNESIKDNLCINYSYRYFTLNEHKRILYDEYTKNMVFNIYQKDFEILNYNKDSIPSNIAFKKFKLESELNETFFDFYNCFKKFKKIKSNWINEEIENLKILSTTFDKFNMNNDKENKNKFESYLLIESELERCILNFLFEKSISSRDLSLTLVHYNEETEHYYAQTWFYFKANTSKDSIEYSNNNSDHIKIEKVYLDKLDELSKKDVNFNKEEKIRLLKYNFIFYNLLSTVEKKCEQLMKFFNANIHLFPKYFIN